MQLDFEEVKKYYNEHMREETATFFNISVSTLKNLCKKNNWRKDKKLIYSQMQTANLQKYGVNFVSQLDSIKLVISAKNSKYNNLDWEEMKNYYITHTRQDTCEKFNINEDTFKKLCKSHKFKKDTHIYAVLDKLNDEEVKLFYDNHTREETCIEFNINNQILSEWTKKTGYKKDPAWVYKNQTSKTCLSKYNKPFYSRKTVYKYNGELFDSLPELAVYYYAVNNNISIKREPCSFEYYFKNKKHSYFPDFEIDGKLVEIKGDHLYKKMLIENTIDNAKLKCIQDNNVELWLADGYQFALDYIKKQQFDINKCKYKKENN